MARKKKMVIGILIVAVILTIGGIILGFGLLVGESQLKVQREEEHFPLVTGNNLDRQEFQFPRDFDGVYNLVIVPFQQRQQLDVNTWIPAAQELERTFPDLIYYELPTIYKLPALSRTFINEGMRAGIPDQTSRERTITLYLDKDTFKSALGITSETEIYLFLVDKSGNILWKETGTFSEQKAAGLVEILQEFEEN